MNISKLSLRSMNIVYRNTCRSFYVGRFKQSRINDVSNRGIMRFVTRLKI